ncbi:MAG: type II toxin-antitoxin system RelE/ParE family toxin [Acidobacteria bacterium]|nr:type II toxin-antitoxin system RelE/ParE family toxin [Acidobacteriota bacterium]
MSWAYRFSTSAAKQFRRLPRDRQEQLSRAIEEMGEDPLKGDVLPVKSGKFKGALRKRVGPYRIIFSLAGSQRLIEVAAILHRTEKTYK